MRYTKKPVTVEAVQFIGLTDFGDPQFDTAPTGGAVPEWLMEAVAGPEGSVGSIWVRTTDDGIARRLRIGVEGGDDGVADGNWIIRGEDGDISQCDPDIFAALYDPADALAAPKLEALDTSGRQAIAAAMDRAGEVTDAKPANREPKPFVIGEGFI